jgi:predicted nucleotide-binding protein
MTKSRSTQQKPQTTTELTISNSEFKQKLEQRLILGEEMLNRSIISDEDLKILNQDSNAWTDYNIEFLKQTFNNPYNEYRNSYKSSGTYWGGIAFPSEPEPIKSKTIIKNQIDNIQNLINKSDLIKSSVEIQMEEANNIIDKTKVFIVHGHDETAETKAARFIEKLGFEAIILHEQASSSKTIIEKIEQYSNVGFGIVLYTPCDLGGKTSDELRYRARQNVVFEHGFLMGKIGRSNVCALVRGDIELPNDISGVVYVAMDNGNAWHFKIAKEMKNSGYIVDMNKL